MRRPSETSDMRRTFSQPTPYLRLRRTHFDDPSRTDSESDSRNDSPFRAIACSFFNPSETRTVITRLQSAFGARNVLGSVLASRRTRDGLLPYNEHDSC